MVPRVKSFDPGRTIWPVDTRSKDLTLHASSPGFQTYGNGRERLPPPSHATQGRHAFYLAAAFQLRTKWIGALFAYAMCATMSRRATLRPRFLPNMAFSGWQSSLVGFSRAVYRRSFFAFRLPLPRDVCMVLCAKSGLTLSRTDWHLGCERSRSPSADRPVRGRCSPARRQLKPTLGRAIDRHRCSLPQRVQLSGRPPASCLQVAEQRRSCPALDGGGQLWLEEGGRFEAAAGRVSFRGCQHTARSPIPCLVRRLPVTCSSSRRLVMCGPSKRVKSKMSGRLALVRIHVQVHGFKYYKYTF